VIVNGDFAKELAFELDFIVNTRNVTEGFPLMEYMRWVHPYFMLMLCTHGMLMLWMLQHARRQWPSRQRRPSQTNQALGQFDDRRLVRACVPA
jgi:hypothetical protein